MRCRARRACPEAQRAVARDEGRDVDAVPVVEQDVVERVHQHGVAGRRVAPRDRVLRPRVVGHEAEVAAVQRVSPQIWDMLASLPREVLSVEAAPGMFYISWKGLENDPGIVEQAYLIGAEAVQAR